MATAQCVLTPPPHLFPMAACFFWQTCSKGEGGAPVTVDTLRNVTIPSEEKVTKLFFLFTSLGTNVPPRWRTLNSGNRRRVSVTIVEASSRAYNTGLHVSRMRGAYMVCVQTHACKRTHAMQAWSNRKSQWRNGPIATRVRSQRGSQRGSERRYRGVRAKVHGGGGGSERRYMGVRAKVRGVRAKVHGQRVQSQLGSNRNSQRGCARILVTGVCERNARLENGKPRLPLGLLKLRQHLPVPTPCRTLGFPRHRPRRGLTCSARAVCG